MMRLTVAMQEDPKIVLRGMLTQVGEGDNFVCHGERLLLEVEREERK